ncbi:MAG: T9SS type A sorting domain-containing protein, partial [Bacteroidales bacterium]
DINEDGIVDMRDWEIGAMLVVNSWGAWWGNQGKVWVMYRLLAEPPSNGGIWEKSAVVVRAKKSHSPMLTAKIGLTYNYRNKLKIQVGIASDLSATEPEKIIDFPSYNFQGGNWNMQGILEETGRSIELGLDITPLINHFPENGEARIFLEIIQKSPTGIGEGKVDAFSVLNYVKPASEFRSDETNVTIHPNTITRLSTVVSIAPERPEIVTYFLPQGTYGASYSATIEAAGGSVPYKWSDPLKGYLEKPLDESISFTGGEKVLPDPWTTHVTRELPFGISLYGKAYNKVTIHANGGVILGDRYVKYPYAINNRLPIYQNSGYFPFFGSLFYPDDSYGVTWETSDGDLIVRWHASLDTLRHRPVTFAARISPTGTCRYYYGDMQFNPGDSWVSAISGGDMHTCYLLNHNQSTLREQAAILLEPATLPAGITFSADGRLSGTPLESGDWIIPLAVKDAYGLESQAHLKLSIRGGSSIDNRQIANKIRLYPNPVNGSGWLETESSTSGEMILTIYDLTGKSHFTQRYTLSAGANRIRIDQLERLETGVYFYQTTGAAIGSGKFTVIR